MWGSIIKVREISGITKEQISDERLTEIINIADRKVRSLAFTYYDEDAIVGKQNTSAIQLLGIYVGDGNFDNVVNSSDITILRKYYENGFTKMQELVLTSFDSDNGIVEFVNPVPSDTCGFQVRCYQNPLNFSYVTLSDASSYFAAAQCFRLVSTSNEKRNKADEFEKIGVHLLKRSSAKFI